MPYFYYRQNNSGGSFDIDDDVSIYVWVEAETAGEANDKAEQIGIYFDGVNSERDCECCGDRWYPAVPSEALGSPILSNLGVRWVGEGQNHTIIYNADGTVGRITREVIETIGED
jgi:hypothetical protein